MTRYKLTLEYDGGGFVGWQRQDNGPSVQEALEKAVAAFCGETVTSFAAGRTDAGVHALGQVAHVDLAKATTADTVEQVLVPVYQTGPIIYTVYCFTQACETALPGFQEGIAFY